MEDIHVALLNEFERRVIDESIGRIRKCLDMLDEKQIWYRQNDQVNSVGNLILHLDGNARQWILSGLTGDADNRERYKEFLPDLGHSKEELEEVLCNLETDLKSALTRITSGTLLKIRKVQVYEESGLSILIHVIEHFSYHTGQITLMTKQMTNRQTHYYQENLEID